MPSPLGLCLELGWDNVDAVEMSLADAFEVIAKIQPGSSARFRITRAAVLTGQAD